MGHGSAGHMSHDLRDPSRQRQSPDSRRLTVAMFSVIDASSLLQVTSICDVDNVL